MSSPEATRRADRTVTDEQQVHGFLMTAPVANVAVVDEAGPYINANLFVHAAEENAIYLHTASEGRLRRAALHGTEACIAVSAMGRLLPAPRAVSFSVEYESVVLFGRLEVVHDLAGAHRVFERLMRKYAPHLAPGRDFEPSAEKDRVRTTVFRFQVRSWTAKKNSAPPDFPGAYDWKAVA